MRTISHQELTWRRDKVRELTTKGWTQRQIAEELKIDHSMINRDLKFMRLRSSQNIQHYIDKILPAEYEGAIDTLNMIFKEMWELEAEDNRELIQSRSLIKDCIAMKIELIASGTVVDRAMKFVNRYRGSLPQSIDPLKDDTQQLIESTG